MMRALALGAVLAACGLSHQEAAHLRQACAFKAGAMPSQTIASGERLGSDIPIEHVIFVMQENRSFDHYFGSIKGVRGFGDPRPATLPNGKTVWHQPNNGGELLPFHPDARSRCATRTTAR